MLEPLAVDFARCLSEPDRHHLRGVVPLVDGGGDVEALVALQADQLALKRFRQDLGDLGLADAGLAFEEERAAQPQRQEQNGRERPVGDIIGAPEQVERFVDRLRYGSGFPLRGARGVCPVLCLHSFSFEGDPRLPRLI